MGATTARSKLTTRKKLSDQATINHNKERTSNNQPQQRENNHRPSNNQPVLTSGKQGRIETDDVDHQK
jgi:hypothetical protein